jgi:hypothetical protein
MLPLNFFFPTQKKYAGWKKLFGIINKFSLVD